MTNNKMTGIVFSNMHDENMGLLTSKRTMGSIPYGGRYRLVDFVLSGMVNAGMTNVGIITKYNYHSLMDHVGSGRPWDLARKRGGLVLLPPYSRLGTAGGIYRGSIEALAGHLGYIKEQNAQYVCISDCDVVTNVDYRAVLEQHQKTGADITIVCCHKEMGSAARDIATVELDKSGRLCDLTVNPAIEGSANVYLNMFVMDREMLIRMIENAYSHGHFSVTQHILQEQMKSLKIYGYQHMGFCRRIGDLESYFAANMALLDPVARAELFPEDRPVYTKNRDGVPTKYGLRSQVSNSLVADGCIIKGTVENCIIFRGVRIGAGAVVKNSIIMQSTIVSENANLDYVITDKNVVVQSNRVLCGYKTIPIYLEKGSNV